MTVIANPREAIQSNPVCVSLHGSHRKGSR